MSSSNITNLISTIDEEAPKAKIFSNKIKVINSVLSTIKNEIEQKNPSINQDDLNKLNEIFNEILRIIRFIGNEEEIQTFFNSTEAIDQPITDINESMNKIIDILNKYDLLKLLKLPSDDLYNDYVYISEHYTDYTYQNPEKIKKRESEIAEKIKQIKKPEFEFELFSKDEDNNSVLDKFPDFKLSPSDYIKKNAYLDNDLFTCYYGEKNSEAKEKLRIMVLNKKLNSKFKQIFTILSTNHHPYLETFVGACIKGPNIEIVTLKAGANLKKLIGINISNSDDDDPDLFDDSEKSFVYLDPGDLTIIAFKIAQGMAYLHSRGIIHRNLSTSNIYIKKVFDKDDPDKYEVIPIITNFANSHLISRNSILGKTNIHASTSISSFIAPELADTPYYNEKVDVFAFGGILFELLTNHSPYDKMKKKGDIWKKLKDGDRPDIPKNCSEKLQNLIKACWAQSPDERPSFEEIIDIMLPKKGQEMLIFSFDEENSESIQQFYDQYLISSSNAKECLDTFESIKNSIGLAYQYRFEFFSIIFIITHYQYMLRNSKYCSKYDLNEEESSKMTNLCNNLKSLRTLILNESENCWLQNSLIKTIDFVSKRLVNLMNSIYQIMKSLGIDVENKYVENYNDLVFDYCQLSGDFQQIIDDTNNSFIYYDESELPQVIQTLRILQDKTAEIDTFFNERNLNESTPDEVLKSQIKDLFLQYKDYRLKEEDFEVSEAISSGATSSVYEGMDLRDGKLVAIKKLGPSFLRMGENSLLLLSREISILTRLKHEYIAHFIGYCIPKDKLEVWLISEKYNNDPISDESISGFNKTKMAFEIAEAMEYIHSKRIMHRDLKTDNILHDDDFCPKIIDFGYSKSDIKDLANTTQRGTYQYMAPEVLSGSNYGSEADVYSFGMILWEMEHNKIPFGNWDDSIIMQKIPKGVKLEFSKNCPEELKNLILRCCKLNQKDRPTFTEIIETMMKKDHYVMFSNTNKEDINDFYEEKEKKRKDLNL